MTDLVFVRLLARRERQPYMQTFEVDWRLIQRLKQLNGGEATTDKPTPLEDQVMLEEATIEEVKDEMIYRRVTGRGDKTYQQVAETLGITKKSLWERRQALDL